MPILPVSKGSCGCVRWPTIAVLISTILRVTLAWWSSPSTIGTSVAEDRAAERDLLALDVVDAFGGAGAVELQTQARRSARPPSGRARMRSSKKSIGLRGDPPARDRPAADDRHRSRSSRPDSSTASRCPPIWPSAAQLFEDLRPFEDAERLVVAQRRRHRIEVVGLLRDVDHRDPHLTPSNGDLAVLCRQAGRGAELRARSG